MPPPIASLVHRALVVAPAACLLLVVSCRRSEPPADDKALRPKPIPTTLSAESMEVLPTPALAGGGPRPLSTAVDGPAEPESGALPWVPSGERRMTQSRTLGGGHFYWLAKPAADGKGPHGLVGGGARQWDDFLQFEYQPDGSIVMNGENERGGGFRFTLAAAAAPPVGEALLIESHPADGGARIVVNGQTAGIAPGGIHANWFGVGYATAPKFRGLLGEIRIYDQLTGPQADDVALLLRTWWRFPGENEGAFPNGFREEPAILGSSTPAGTSGELLALVSDESGAPVFIGRSPEGPPRLDELPEGMTLRGGTTWHLHSATAQRGRIAIDPARTLPAGLLGEHGFYALLHRTGAAEPWREAAAASPTAEGRIDFPEIELTPGFYSLAIVQGVPQRANASRLALNGKAIEDGRTIIEPGKHAVLTCIDSAPGQHLILEDSDFGAVWFDGPAAGLKLEWFPLRRPSTSLHARFSNAPGVLAGDRTHALELDPGAPRLYPGLRVEILRRAGEAIDPRPNFVPEAGWPARLNLGDYPPFRTGESIHTPPFDNVTAPWWKPPSFLRNHLPTLTISPDARRIAELGAIHSYPFNDIDPRFRVHARISGELLLHEPGTHEFLLECPLPGTVRLGTATVATGEPVSIELAGASSVPLEILVANTAEYPHLASRLMWKASGTGDFSTFSAGRLVHRTELTREAALAAVSNGFAHRTVRLTRAQDDSAAVELLGKIGDGGIDAEHFKDSPTFTRNAGLLTSAFLEGRTLSGNPSAARAAIRLIEARSQFLRENRNQLTNGGFGKTDGRTIRLFESSRGFFAACEAHPNFQSEALAARAELASYAVATCLSRSFFAETHHGTNDGYGDDDNLLVNFWRAARALDDPDAWDAAACLQDSHFRYAPGTAEGLSSDGLFIFHNANGRHIHMDGYGLNWFDRVANANRFGSPWGYTPEQYRRLAGYLLAYEWLLYRGTQPFTAKGRHNDHKGDIWQIARRMKHLLSMPEGTLPDDAHRSLEEAFARIQANADCGLEGNRFFHRNLYAVHRRKDWFIDLKMIAPGIGGPETFAGAYPWNMAFGDGVTTLMRDGREYAEIHRNAPNASYADIRGWKDDTFTATNLSLWQYRALPGTTMLDDERHHPDRYRSGSGETAGGVSDGRFGHAAFHYVNPQTGSDVRKFFGFTDDGMLVLASGITGTRVKLPEGVTMRSNLNQCDARGPVRILAADGNERILPAEGSDVSLRFPLDQSYWIEHGGIGYLILPTGAEAGPGNPGTLQLDFGVRTPLTPVPGFTLPERTAKAITEKVPANRKARIFHLSIDHGAQVRDGAAAWFVCMDAAGADPAAWLCQSPVEILANTPAVQAFRDGRDGLAHAFFRETGKVIAGDQLLFNAPTPMSVMWNPATRAVTVQDVKPAATRKPEELFDRLEPTLGPGLDGIDTPIPVSIDLPGTHDPDDRFRGGSMTRRIQ